MSPTTPTTRRHTTTASPVATTPAYGALAQAGYELRNNTFTLAPAGPGVASRHVGVSLLYQGTAFNNTFTALAVGLEARSGEWYMATNYDIEKNTFADNTEGVSFLPPTYYNGPPTMSVTLRCNTFRSTVAGATGVWVKAGALFPTALGSLSTPNGNNFSGITNVKKRFVYDVTPQPGANAFTYYRYDSGQEVFGGITGDILSESGGSQLPNSTALASNTRIAGTNACGTSTTPGVYARPVSKPSASGASGSPSAAASLGGGYPNPASETVTFAYAVPGDDASAALVLRDLLGREVARQQVGARNGQAVVPVRQLPAGFYTAALEVQGHCLHSQKVTVTH